MNATAKDAEGRTALHHAVMRGHLRVVQLLVDRGPPELLLSKDILGCTPVHLAAVQNQVTLILMLVSALLKDEQGTTPLHEIARRKCLQVTAPPENDVYIILNCPKCSFTWDNLPVHVSFIMTIALIVAVL